MNIIEEMIDQVMENVGELFDFFIHYEQIDSKQFMNYFLNSRFIKELEKGNTHYCLGMTGIELGLLIAKEFNVIFKKDDKKYSYIGFRSKEYWIGYVSTFYIWSQNKSYEYLFNLVSYEEFERIYPIYHEQDEQSIISYVNKRKKNILHPLKTYRVKKNLSQSELSMISGVSLRQIQAFEQYYKDINKADAMTLYKLSLVLDVDMKDLLDI